MKQAKVSYSITRTINLGNYESARVDVGLKLPCYIEEIPAAFEKAQRIVQARLVKESEEIKEYKRERDGK